MIASFPGPLRRRSFSRKRFGADPSGSVAIVATLLTPLFVVGLGVGIDMTLVYESRVNLQQSLDAAGLAAARQYDTSQDPAALEALAKKYFNANASADAAAATTFAYGGVRTEDGNLVMTVSGTRSVPTYFGNAIKYVTGGKIDYTKVGLSAASEVVIGGRSVELVLVLDNSGSMGDKPDSGGKYSKITLLKSAVGTLVDQVMAAGASTNAATTVKIGVVPFSSAVNVGVANAAANWMDTKGLSPIHHENFDWTTYTSTVAGVSTPQAVKVPVTGGWKNLSGDWLTRFWVWDNAKRNGSKMLQPWRGCVESRPNGLAFTDAVPTEYDPQTLFVPMFAPDEYAWSGSNNEEAGRNDYLTDQGPSGNTDANRLARQRNMNKYLNATTAPSDTDGPNYRCDLTAITPLTATKTTVQNAVKALVAAGSTNIPEGLAWGWRVLSPSAPFTEGKAAGENVQKVLVLITDGDNTYNLTLSNGSAVEMPSSLNRSPYGTYGFGQAFDGTNAKPGRMFDGLSATTKTATGAHYVDAMNEMMGKVCSSIKNDKITVVTVAFDLDDGTKVKTLLQNCASDGVNGYYDVKDEASLMKFIQSLVQMMSSLRVAK